MDIVAARIIVRGRVQGVGFRWFARDAAEGLSEPGRPLKGWVANRHDGGVELEVAGDADLVEALVQRLQRGPPGAAVTGVDVQALPEAQAAALAGAPAGRFEIRPTR